MDLLFLKKTQKLYKRQAPQVTGIYPVISLRVAILFFLIKKFLMFLFYFIIFCLFAIFLGPLPRHIEVPRPGVESEL